MNEIMNFNRCKLSVIRETPTANRVGHSLASATVAFNRGSFSLVSEIVNPNRGEVSLVSETSVRFGFSKLLGVSQIKIIEN